MSGETAREWVLSRRCHRGARDLGSLDATAHLLARLKRPGVAVLSKGMDEDVADLLDAFASELEETADAHRGHMARAEDPVEAAEHRGISRGMLFVASKIRTAILTAR